MEFKAVVSDNINGVHYDDTARVMTVEFKGGGTYAYYDVPEDVYEELLTSGSPGSYLHDAVKGVYRYTKIR